jgi:hypothetical protein
LYLRRTTFASSTSLPHELSTIIEADTSGLSKHIPCVDLSQLSESSRILQTDAVSLPTPSDSDQHNVSLLSLKLSSALDDHTLDDLVLDLLTSKVDIEVQEALSAKGCNTTATWPEEGAISVVNDAEQSVLEDLRGRNSSSAVEQRNTSLNLAALDADLAQILESNTISHPTNSFELTPTASPGLRKTVDWLPHSRLLSVPLSSPR